MARAQVAILDSGDLFPSLTFTTVGGNSLNIPDDLAGKWSVVLLYRGDWCRYCRQQLLDYQVHAELYKKLDIQVIAASVDSLEKAQTTVDQLHLTYPVAYGLDAKEISSALGVYYDDAQYPPYIHATGFLLSPGGKVFNAAYSSRSIGRLTAQDAATLVEIVRSRESK